MPDQSASDSSDKQVDALERLIESVRKEIDRHHFYCYGEGSFEVIQTGNVIVYVIRGNDFMKYMARVYGPGELEYDAAIRGLSEARLQTVDIFSEVWTAAFGFPFAQSAFQSQSLSVTGSFECLNPTGLQKGYGVITEISSNYMVVRTSQGNVRLRMSPCTRLESTSAIPSVGQNLAYSGIAYQNLGYNLYQGTCF